MSTVLTYTHHTTQHAQALRELLRFLRFRADAGLELLLPRCVDDNGAASAGGSYEDDGFGSDDDGGGAAGRIAKSQQPGRRRPQPSQDSDSDESMMGDSDDEDRGGSAGGRGRRGGAFGDGDDSVMMVAAGRRGRGRGGGRTPDGTLACALAGGRFALKDLAGWARAALVLCPTHLRAPAFLRAAGGLLQAAEGERVDLPALWRDGLFLLADPEVGVVVAIGNWKRTRRGMVESVD